MNDGRFSMIEDRLLTVLGELRAQPEVASAYEAGLLPYAEEIAQIAEFIDAGEYGLAYEYVVTTLERRPFVLRGATAVRLLELALLFRYKTDDPVNARSTFARRRDAVVKLHVA